MKTVVAGAALCCTIHLGVLGATTGLTAWSWGEPLAAGVAAVAASLLAIGRQHRRHDDTSGDDHLAIPVDRADGRCTP